MVQTRATMNMEAVHGNIEVKESDAHWPWKSRPTPRPMKTRSISACGGRIARYLRYSVRRSDSTLEFPRTKTTKLSVETRSGSHAQADEDAVHQRLWGRGAPIYS